MGQSVSVDAELWDLKDLCRMVELPAGPETAGSGQPSRRVVARHHVKVWQLEERGRAVVEFPVALCDKRGILNAEIQRNCSYLILHLWAPSTANEDPPTSASAAVLEDLAARAGAAFTPRGLAASPILNTSGADAGVLRPALRHAIFVWHGVDVSKHVKARAFARAFELDGAICDGLLQHHAFLESLCSAVVLRSMAGASGSQQCVVPQGAMWCPQPRQAAEPETCGRNQLLLAMLRGTPGAPGCRSRGATHSGVAGCHRFPRVGKSVRVGQAVPSAHSTAAGAPANVPRLAMGVGAPEKVSMDVDRSQGPDNNTADGGTLDDGIRKRLRGGARVAGFPSCRSGGGGTAEPTVPGSARREEGWREPGSQHRSAIPVLNLSPVTVGGQRVAIAERLEAPAMLNLEEINMSEEDMIRSYDPNNEENNYHLPDHLYKALQLKQYRQACSEVIANSVYLGGYQVAGDLECLQRNRITHIVNMAADVCDSSFPEHFSYLTYYLKDTNSEDISPLFYRTLDWMQSAVASGGRVLVHCREGVSRSATMAIAYLMWRQGLPFEAAHEKLRKARPICNPNTGFTCQLLMLGKRLGVSSSHPGQVSMPNSVVERPQLFRVAPHHSKEPSLVLTSADWPRSWPYFDPRFGWVILHAAQAILWLGLQVPHPEAVEAMVKQHVRLVEAFERRDVTVTVVPQGAEAGSSHLWQSITSVPPGGPKPDLCALAADANPAFDADFEILRASSRGTFGGVGADDVVSRSSLSSSSLQDTG